MNILSFKSIGLSSNVAFFFILCLVFFSVNYKQESTEGARIWDDYFSSINSSVFAVMLLLCVKRKVYLGVLSVWVREGLAAKLFLE